MKDACADRIVLPVLLRRSGRRRIDLSRACRMIDAGYSVRSTARLLRVPLSTLRSQLARADDHAAIERAADRALVRDANHREAVEMYRGLEQRREARGMRRRDEEWFALFRGVYFVGVPPVEWGLAREECEPVNGTG